MARSAKYCTGPPLHNRQSSIKFGAAAPEPTRPAGAMAPSSDNGMPTVLLVDDESSVRGALRKLFERAGLSVLEADSGRGALEAIASDPGISAVVSDFLMPEINGLDFYDALVARSPHLRERVVFLTGAARDPQVHQSLEQRGVPLISKLDDLHIVLDAVKLALLRRH